METQMRQRVSVFFLIGLVCLSPWIYDLLAWMKDAV